MKNFTSKVFSICLYVLAGLLFAYSIWALTNSISYIGEMINSGQLAFAGNEYDIINFYMGNCTQYFVFAVLLAAVGFLVWRDRLITTTSTRSEKVISSKEDAELDDWFEKMK